MGRRRVACRLFAVSNVDVGRSRRSDENFVCVLLHLQLTVKNVTAWLTFAFPSKKELKAEGFSCASAIVSLKSRTSSIDAQARVIRLGDVEEQRSIRHGLFLSTLLYDIKSNQIEMRERKSSPVGRFFQHITGKIIACYPTCHCQCIYMTHVWNWALECLYMSPTGLFTQTAGKRRRRNVFVRIKFFFWISLWKIQTEESERETNEKEKERKRGNVEKFSMDRTSDRRNSYCDWIDAVTQERKEESGKGLESMGSQHHNKKKDLFFVFLFSFRFLSENKLLWAISLSKTSSSSYYSSTEKTTNFVALHFLPNAAGVQLSLST